MNLYSVIAFLRYFLRARSRHAVHAPIAYECVDQVIRPRRPRGLIHRLRRHYPHKPLWILQGFPQEDALPLLDQLHAVLIFPQPHSCRLRYQAWKAWLAQDKIKLSIDLFQIGILLLDPGLIQSQHYTIRYIRKERFHEQDVESRTSTPSHPPDPRIKPNSS